MATLIAECCQNHNGDLAILKDMIWAAADAGAEFVKMQSITADELTSRPEFEEGVTEDGVVKTIKRPYQKEFDRLKPMDLTPEAHQWFIEECERAKVKPLTTAFTRGKIEFLKSLKWRSIKVASYDCASFPMIEELRDSFDQLFVSTGATFDEEIATTAALLRGKQFSFLHCVTIYPTPLNQLHLARMEWLKQFTPSVGFSDHTLVARDGIKASTAALALGADVIERHFTILPADQTKDGPVSINPTQLRELVAFSKLPEAERLARAKAEIPEFESMLGQKTRPLSDEELLNRGYYRGRFATKRDGRVIYNWE